MSAPTKSQEPPKILVEILDDLDEPTIHAVRRYVEQRLDDLRPSLQEQIRSETDGKIVDIEDCGACTFVRKYPPLQGDSESVSQPLSLYRVSREKQLNGENALHWSYLGDVVKQADIECRNYGTLVNTHEPACPHHGEETALDNEEI